MHLCGCDLGRGHGLLRDADDRGQQVVVEVAPHAGGIAHDVDAELPQVLGRADAGAQQQRRVFRCVWVNELVSASF